MTRTADYFSKDSQDAIENAKVNARMGGDASAATIAKLKNIQTPPSRDPNVEYNPTGDYAPGTVSGIDTALSNHADKLHPVKR